MAWLRVDDGLAEHRKLLKLRRSERWTWVELLCYVARQNNGGHIPPGIADVLRHVNTGFLARCTQIGLLDQEGDEYVVHDWDDYNPKDPSSVERSRRYRSRNKTVTDA